MLKDVRFIALVHMVGVICDSYKRIELHTVCWLRNAHHLQDYSLMLLSIVSVQCLADLVKLKQNYKFYFMRYAFILRQCV